jgi:hypothetical protein
VTPRRTPRHRRPSKHQQKRNFPITTPRYLTPPDSGSSGSSRQTNNHRISKIGISNFKANLIAASRLSLRPSDDDNDDDNVQVIGTRLNVGYRATGHSWTMEERKFLVMLKRFWVADLLAITTIMNALFPKALVPFKSRMVNMQYQEISAGKQCGDDADIAWDIVWNTIDFSLASRKFQPVLEKFEEMAAGVGVAITRRVEEDDRQAIYADRRKHIPKRSTIQRRETSHTERVVRGSQAAVPAKVRAGDIANAASYSEAQAQRQAIVEMRADIPLVRNDDPIQNGKLGLILPPKHKLTLLL